MLFWNHKAFSQSDRTILDQPIQQQRAVEKIIKPGGDSFRSKWRRNGFRLTRDLPNPFEAGSYLWSRDRNPIANSQYDGGTEDVRFYYCGGSDIILQSSDNADLTSLASHSNQTLTGADQLVRETMGKLPNCRISLTND